MSDWWFNVNGRRYPRPRSPVVVVCLDGTEPEYLTAAFAAGALPSLSSAMVGGMQRADSVIPSFTNPNNMSIATGVPPAKHGISGNTYFDRQRGVEVMMNDVGFLRCGTIFAAAQNAEGRVAVVAAKDKLRALLSAGLDIAAGTAICFSSETAASTTLKEHGIENAAKWLGRSQPDMYSAELSEFVFASGVKLLEDFQPDVMYLTTSDYIQHTFSPAASQAIEFYAMFDRYFDQLQASGAVVAVTADHGMKPKHDADGQPQVVYLQDLMDQWVGFDRARVILPITDPYVLHHGALGSFATIYFQEGAGEKLLHSVIDRIRATTGICLALDGDEASLRYQLPRDRIGDLVAISHCDFTIGTSRDRHDLGALQAPLRSHGGLSEQIVPFIINRRLGAELPSPLRNFDAFAVAMQAAKENADG